MIINRYGRNNNVYQYMDYERLKIILRLRNRLVRHDYYSNAPPWIMNDRLKRRVVRPEINRLPMHNLRMAKSWMPGGKNLLKKYTWSDTELAKSLKYCDYWRCLYAKP